MIGVSSTTRKRKDRDPDDLALTHQAHQHRPAPFQAQVTVLAGTPPDTPPTAGGVDAESDESRTPSPPREASSVVGPSPKPTVSGDASGEDDQPPRPASSSPPAKATSNNTTSNTTGGTAPRTDEYEAGRVVCEACGSSVSFRDNATGGFTMTHWEAHRNSCPAAPSRSPPASRSTPSASTSLYTSTHAPHSPSHPHPQNHHPLSLHALSLGLSPTSLLGASTSLLGGGGPANPKRRRAKRTEEERIEYLRSDPYVAEFEAYRVLCASCDKWIRLRPNSTYCSIPWDAHRKSCLAKKVTAKNPYALSERNTLFSNDPDVRKFDPERLLCNLCDRWIALPPDDHLAAVQMWLGHRAGCGRRGGGGEGEAGDNDGDGGDGADAEGEEEEDGKQGGDGEDGDVKVKEEPRPSTADSQHPTRFPPIPPPHPNTSHQNGPSSQPSSHASGTHPSSSHPHNPSPSPPYNLTLLTYAPSHESRRRNAEQRAATLRADRLIGRVEPNRVFCSLCEKWVQLRQDSSYCAYPWVQHRGKCLRRSERRNAKAAEIGHGLGPKPSSMGPSASGGGGGGFTRRPLPASAAAYATHPPHPGHHLGPAGQSASSRPYGHGHGHRDTRHHGHGHGHAREDGRHGMRGEGYHHHGHHPAQAQRHRTDADGEVANANAADEDEDQLMSDSAPPSRDLSTSLSQSQHGRERDEDEMMHRAGAPVVSDSEGSESDDESPSGARESEEGIGAGQDKKRPHGHAQAQAQGDGAMGLRQRHSQHHHPHNQVQDRRKEYPPSLGVSRHDRAHHPSSPTSARHGHGHQHPQHGHQGGGAKHARYAAPSSQKGAGSSMSHAIFRSNASSANANANSNPNISSGPYDHGTTRLGPGTSTNTGMEDDADVDAEGDADLDAEEEWGGDSGWVQVGGGEGGIARGVPRRPHPVGLADLDSTDGRKQFIHTSLHHLFQTTYEATDDLSISSLLTYLNAAMPPDKHEDFDTTEVARAVGALAERGRVRFEGDVLRIVS